MQVEETHGAGPAGPAGPAATAPEDGLEVVDRRVDTRRDVAIGVGLGVIGIGALMVVPVAAPASPVLVWGAVALLVGAAGYVPARRFARWPREDRRAAVRAVVPAAAVALAIAIAVPLLVGALLLVPFDATGLAPSLWRLPFDGGLVALVVGAAVALTYALRHVTPLGWTVWATRRGLPPRAAPDGALELRRTRVWRTVPAVVGAFVGAAPQALSNVAFVVGGFDDTLHQELMDRGAAWPFDPVSLALLGYLLGTIAAEATRRRPAPADTPGGAWLDTRTPAQYLTPLARWLPPVLGAACVFVTAVAQVRGSDEIWWPAALAAALAIAAVGAQRWVVRRRQRVIEPAALAVDDALRSSAAHAIAGSSSALLLVLTVGALQPLLGTVDAVSANEGVLGLLLGLGLVVGICLLWFGYGSAHRGRTPHRAEDGGRAPGEPVA